MVHSGNQELFLSIEPGISREYHFVWAPNKKQILKNYFFPRNQNASYQTQFEQILFLHIW